MAPASPKKTLRKIGRPRLPAGQAGRRYQIYLAPLAADKLRRLGEGSLSAGINKLLGEQKAP